MLKKIIYFFIFVCLIFPLAAQAKRTQPKDKIYLKGGEVIEGRIHENNDSGYILMQGNRKRYVDERTIEKVEWDTQRRKLPWSAQWGAGLNQALSPAAFANRVKSGLSLGAGIGFQIAPRWTIQADLDYSLIPLDGDLAVKGLGTITSIEGGDSFLGTGLVNFRVYPFSRGGKIAPYLLAGAGVYNLSTRFLEIVQSNGGLIQAAGGSRSGFAAAAGVGLEVFFNRHMGLFVEARWVNALSAFPSDALNAVPVRAGLSLRYGRVNSGTTADK